MENKRTEELRRMHASVKAKLMSAIAMLLVATIMMSSTTYAWFVLSTAPEVKGMTTTVGSNGSLEIALLNNDTAQDTSTISSAVGDSSATKEVTYSNETWGNIVDLSASYGLDTITLYPSALNISGSALADFHSPVSVPVYGVDGRVAELSNDSVVSGKLKTSENGTYFVGSTEDFGVRAIGTASNVDPIAKALDDARSNYRLALTAVKSLAKNMLNGENNANAMAVTKILIGEKIKNNQTAIDQGVSVTATEEDIEALGNMIGSMEETILGIKGALAYYVVGYEAAKNGKVIDVATVGNSLGNYSYISTYVTELTALESSVANIKTIYNQEAEKTTGQEFSKVISLMVDSSKATLNDKLLNEYSSDAALDLLFEPRIGVNGGVLSDFADFVDSFVSNRFSVPLSETVAALKITNATITVNPNYTPATDDDATARINPYLPYLRNDTTVGLDHMTTQSGATGETMISTEYGYAIDLAFRASTTTNLLLSPAAKRVNTDGTDAPQGGGSTFALDAGSDIADLAALRVVFVENNEDGYNILGVAKVDTTETAGSYALHLYEWTTDEAGVLTLGAQKTTDELTNLAAGVVKKVTAIVYLDGNFVGSSLASARGTLNLQFSSSTELTPMDYTGFVSTIVPETTNPTTESSEPEETT